MKRMEKTTNHFGVVVVVYGKGADCVLKNYPAIYEQLASKGVPIAIVDHGGHAYLPECFMRQGITYLRQDNRGFGAGVNLGCKNVLESASHAIVLNPDLDFDVNELYQVGNCLLGQFSVIQTQERGKKQAIMYYSHITGIAGDSPLLGGIPYFNGAAFSISRDAFKDTSGFDENFFLYFEDVDFSLKLAQKNIPMKVIETNSFIHEVGGSRTKGMSGFIQRAAAISALRLVWKWFPWNIWLYFRYGMKWLLADLRSH